VFGKHFSSMYTGSMVGAGAINFAVMGYVIANCQPDRTYGAIVEMNPVLLSAILGESVADVEAAIKFLCSPDPQSRTKDRDGRRLIQLGQFDYQVVNGAKYRAIRDEEKRREQNRIAQANFRKKDKPLRGEVEAVKKFADGKVDKNFQPIDQQ
jgi:hypothetical protein